MEQSSLFQSLTIILGEKYFLISNINWGRRSVWLNRKLSLELWEKKKRVYDLWNKGQATQEEYKNAISSCRKKIRKAKAQLQFNLAAAVKDNKKCFYKHIDKKRRAKENVHSLLSAERDIVTKNEAKVEVPNTFFISVFNSKANYL